MILTEQKLGEPFYEKELQEIKKNLELEKQSRQKVINYMLNENDTIFRLIAGQTKKTLYK